MIHYTLLVWAWGVGCFTDRWVALYAQVCTYASVHNLTTHETLLGVLPSYIQ